MPFSGNGNGDDGDGVADGMRRIDDSSPNFPESLKTLVCERTC